MTARACRVISLVCASAPLLLGCDEPVVKVFEYQASAPIFSTPAMTKDLIIFGSENGEEAAINRVGEFSWKYSTRREVVGAIKTSADGMVFFGSTNNTFYAVDMSGREVWKYTTLGRIKGDPLVLDKDRLVIFGSYDKHVYALNTLSAAVQWTYPVEGAASAPASLSAAAVPPSASSSTGGAPAKAATPAPKKDEPAAAPAEKVEPGDAFSYSSPILIGSTVVLGNLDGYVYGIDSKNGQFQWRFKTDGAANKKGVTSTVLEWKDQLIFGANDGNVYSISRDGQKLNWKFKTGDEVNATAIADDDTIYIGGVDRKFYALDATGKEKWHYEIRGPVMGRAAILKNLVVFAGGTSDNTAYALDKATGKPFWAYTTEGKVEADMLVEGDRLYVASGDKRLYCFQFNKTTN